MRECCIGIDRVCESCHKNFISKSRKGRFCSLACFRNQPIADRFHAKLRLEAETGCVLWLGKRDRKGYGRLKRGGKRRQVFAHRVAYELANGPIPHGMCVLHRCDNPSCVNPVHLFLGTVTDNDADKLAKGRQAKGETLSDKLTNRKVGEIRQRYAVGDITQQALADAYGVSQTLIGMIVRRAIWKHATSCQTPT